jgi:hypothetical protein
MVNVNIHLIQYVQYSPKLVWPILSQPSKEAVHLMLSFGKCFRFTLSQIYHIKRCLLLYNELQGLLAFLLNKTIS